MSLMLGVYVHVPFCSAICAYCNFNRGSLDAELKTRYVGALEREIREAGDGRSADTIFFGGGTPSLLEPYEIARIIAACRDAYAIEPGAEITLETNPETATPERLAAFRQAGVTRISFGVQSFDDGELQRLGRIHSAARAIEVIRNAGATGFESLSFDLMFWLPGQSRATWRATIDRAVELAPQHLSLYLLELYPNAPLKEAMAREAGSREGGKAGRREGGKPTGDWAQASDDEAADMYLEALEALDAAGYGQYEISNVARPGHHSRHNVKYWQGGDWRGFGCGAHSTVDGVRWRNVSGTADYVQRIGGGQPVSAELRHMSAEERLEEALFTGLRLTSGVAVGTFSRRYGVDPWLRYGAALDPFVGDGLMWKRDDAFGLTRRGMLVANEILATFV